MENYLTQITNYLLTQSWQIGVLVAVIAAVTLALKNRSAHVRYLLWLIVLAKCLVPPLVTIPLAVLPQDKMPGPTLISSGEMPAVNVEMADTVMSEPIVLPSLPITSPTIMERLTRVTARQWLGFGWIVGVAAFLLFAVIKALRTDFWLWRQRKLLPAELQIGIENLFSGLGIKALPKVWLVEGIGQPFVWGLLRGSIYLPADFVKVNSAEHRRGVLGHELGHILRFDAAVNILQIIAQAIFWFHPFVWWANQRVRAEREKCCDEMTIARLGAKVRDYSIAIVNTLVVEHESTRPVPSLAVAGPVKNIEERIKTIMRPGKRFYKRPSLRAVIVLLLVALFTVPIGCALIRRARTETATERAEKRYASLYEAAKAGDLVEVKRLIAKAADVNAFDKEDGLTPLGVAAVECHTEIVKVLLDSGANVDVADTVGYSPIYYAVLNYGEETVEETIRALISGGADVNLTQDKDDTPLLTAIWGDQTDIVKTLLNAGANAKLKDDKGISPLQHAVNTSIPGIVTLLVDTDDTVPDLHRASLKGDLSKLKELLVEGADINAEDGYQLTPLDYALAAGQSNAAKFLLNQGADINIHKTPRYGDYSLLRGAIRAGLLEIVQILIEKGIPVDINHFGTARSAHTALHVAASYGHKEIAEFLISKGAALDSKGLGNQSTPLHVAASIGDTDIVELLITNGADINASNYRGRTPLDVAIDVARQRSHTKHTKIVDVLRQHGAKETLYGAFILGDTNKLKSLISQGADINIEWPIPGGMTLLHHVAAEKGYKDIAKLLIDKGADVNAQNRVNVTPLHLGVENGNKDVVELLIDNGADVNAKRNTRSRRSRNASTALHDAVDASRGDIVELLIAHGADVNARTDLGITPLYIAEQNGYTEIVGLLLKHGAKEISPSLFGAYAYGEIEQIQALLSQGADVNAKNNSGQTLLHLACRWVSQTGNKEVAELLIDKGADINASSGSFGRTPLHQAVITGKTHIVELLIDKGADVNASDNRGRTPLALAKQRKHSEVINILRQHGATETLHGAVASGDIDEVKRLLSEGHDINSRDSEGQTPLHLAVESGNREMVKFLLTRDADVRAEDNERYTPTPLGRAARRQRKEVVEILLSGGADIQNIGAALHLLAWNGQIEMLDFMLSRGADIEAKSIYQLTPLREAVYNKQYETVKFLIDKGADIYAEGGPIFTAIHRNDKKMIELLITNGADITTVMSGETALHRAMADNLPEIVRFLRTKGCETSAINLAAFFGELDRLKKLVTEGADVNATDDCGYGPLHCAICGIHNDVVEFLLAKGTDVNANISKGKGWTPLMLSVAGQSTDIVRLLVAKGAEVNLSADNGNTNLHIAVNRHNPDLVKILLDHGANINARAGSTCAAWEGWTAFHVACRHGKMPIVEMLVTHGADVNIRTDKGDTPMSLARKNQHPDVIELLRKHGAKE